MTFESTELMQNDFYDGGNGRINLIRLAAIDRPRTGFGPNNMFQIVRARFAGARDPTTGISQLHKRNKLILLMHERAFRHYGSGPDKSKYLDYLRSFITSCRNAGYLFDFVANY
jgi:hypothetical protein